jgi:RHS repeat-associated protein
VDAVGEVVGSLRQEGAAAADIPDPWAQAPKTLEQKLTEQAQIYHFHTDPSGLPEELSDDSGQVRWRAYDKTWGNTQAQSWAVVYADGSPVHPSQITRLPEGQPAPVEQNLRFQGQYLDTETGLHYNTFRYYDPDIGRFISPDPIGLEGGSICMSMRRIRWHGWILGGGVLAIRKLIP